MSYIQDDPKSIQNLFGSIASNYDRTNGILSFQKHRKWNRALVQEITKDGFPETLVDLCAGTGAIGYEFLKRTPRQHQVYFVDFSKEMLDCARKKAERYNISPHTLTYLQADVMDLPLLEETASCATVAYGIRNVKDPAQFAREVHRILQPGGTFAILELTRPNNRFLRLGHSLYLKTLLPLIGKIATENKDAYRYLCNSIHTFVEPEKLQKILEEAFFSDVKITPLSGGIATIITAKK